MIATTYGSGGRDGKLYGRVRRLPTALRRAREAEDAGRSFSNFSERLSGSEREVMLFLRKRSRVLQFAAPDVVGRLGCPTRIHEFERLDK